MDEKRRVELMKERAEIAKRLELGCKFLKFYDDICESNDPKETKNYCIAICNLIVKNVPIDINSEIVNQGKLEYYKTTENPYDVRGDFTEYVKTMEWQYGYSLSTIEDIEKELNND